MHYILLLLLISLYISLNIYVSKRIKKARYLDEQRRKLHLRLIWFVPFLGPWIIKSFWKKPPDKLEIMFGEDRKRKPGGGFYESKEGWHGH